MRRFGSRVRQVKWASRLALVAVLGWGIGAGSSSAQPTATLSPTSLTFASQDVGTTSAAQTVTLTNTGNALLSITTITLTGDFFATTTCDLSTGVAAGGSCTISVTFTPSMAGTRTGTLSVADNASGSPQTVSLTGTAVAPTLTLAPTSLTFASQAVGSTSAAQTVTLTNTSSDVVLNITSITLTGDFLATTTCGSSVAAGASCTISVTFTPSLTGTRTGTLSIADNASGSPQTVSLSGTGVAPTLTFTPTSLSFGNEVVGIASTAQIVTVSANGSVSFTSIVTSGDFAATNTCGTSLAVGQTCTISVTFTPTTTGTRTGAVTLTDSGSGSPQSISLTGTGLAPGPRVTLSPTSLTFPNQFVGTTSAAMTVTLTNSGSATLDVSSVTITGTNSGDFTQTNTCEPSVAVGKNCSISVTFEPAASGTRTATLTLNDNAVTGSSQTVSLTGTGAGATVVLSPTSLTFASQILNTASAPQTVTLKNTGNEALSVTGITITGTNTTDFSQSNTCTSSISAGSSCTISVTFMPTGSGNRTASLSIADNAAGSPQTEALTGMGADFSLTASPSSATITAGQTATYTLTVTPLGGFNAAVALSCADNEVPLSSCTISPSTLIPNGSSALTATLSLGTTAPSGLVPDGGPRRWPPLVPRWPWLLGLGLGVLTMLARRRRFALVLGATALSVVLCASCGGSTQVSTVGTTPGNYSVSISGTSSSLTHDVTVTVSVQ